MSTSVLLISFAAGVLSFVSPCIIPMLGVYFSLITGLTVSELKEVRLDREIRMRVVKNTLAFVAGFGLVFVAAGALAGKLGAILGRGQGLLNFVGGTVILILALKLLGVFDLPFLAKTAWEPAIFAEIRTRATRSAWSAFVVGLLFAIACSHCIAPTLYSIIAVAGATKSTASGMLVMLMFTLGLAIPYILAGLAFNRVIQVLKRLRNKQVIVERLAGLLMLYMAYVIYTNQLTVLTGYLARILPRLPVGM